MRRRYLSRYVLELVGVGPGGETPRLDVLLVSYMALDNPGDQTGWCLGRVTAVYASRHHSTLVRRPRIDNRCFPSWLAAKAINNLWCSICLAAAKAIYGLLLLQKLRRRAGGRAAVDRADRERARRGGQEITDLGHWRRLFLQHDRAGRRVRTRRF